MSNMMCPIPHRWRRYLLLLSGGVLLLSACRTAVVEQRSSIRSTEGPLMVPTVTLPGDTSSPSSTVHTGALHEQLNGVWGNEQYTFIAIDFTKGTYDGLVIQQPFSYKLQLLNEQANAVTFQAGDETMTAVFQDPNTIVLQSSTSDEPMTLHRKPAP